MEEKRPGQTPEAAAASMDDGSAARTRPVDGGTDVSGDAEAARAATRAADAESAAMKARGFGSHKGTEAD